MSNLFQTRLQCTVFLQHEEEASLQHEEEAFPSRHGEGGGGNREETCSAVDAVSHMNLGKVLSEMSSLHHEILKHAADIANQLEAQVGTKGQG